MIALQLKNISFSYDKDKKILENLNLSVEEGELISIFGDSGIGKSTLLKIICGLEDINEGQIYLYDREISKLDASKRKIVMTLQDSYLFQHMSVKENIGFSMKMQSENKKTIEKRVSELLKIIELEGYEEKKPKNLSGGQKKRVALARAICNYPKVLLLDEPFTGLDKDMKDKMIKLIADINKKEKITIVLVSHDFSDIKKISNRLLKLENRTLKEVERTRE